MAESTIGVLGLGKMGSNIARQLIGKGYKVIVYNRSREPIDELVGQGAAGADSVEDLVSKLGTGAGKIVWLMLPAGRVTDEAVGQLAGTMTRGDIIIDGSNSYFKEDLRHKEVLGSKGIALLDAGCSGGPYGALHGMSIMVGGDRKTFENVEYLFRDLSVKDGYTYVGGTGSGHFTKMVHNAIEYGMMESIAEGLELIKRGPYKDVDLASLLKTWNNGSVISGRLIELSESAVRNNAEMSGIMPHVEDTGEGRWSSMLALEYGVPFGSISNALFNRFSSRDDMQYGRRFLAALRHEFGGHEVIRKDD
ncbi:MAG: decarboxylating 6-phosphogluconate dehydrogenase [Candidatus Marsarchaeota archaeon]|nr:decarboxylating 6-phosphogluconate dehydrogenase [Candidatus Marsarchaeota archaeon]